MQINRQWHLKRLECWSMKTWYKEHKGKKSKDKPIKLIPIQIKNKMMQEKRKKQEIGMTGKMIIKKVQEIKDSDDLLGLLS